MKTNLLLLVLLWTILTVTGLAQATDSSSDTLSKDNNFVSQSGKFRVTLPSGFTKLNFSTRSNATDAGTLQINQYGQDLARGTCMIAYYDLPESLFQTKGLATMLEDGVAGAIKQAQATLTKKEEITVDGFSGRSIYVKIENNGKTIYARSVFVIAKPRMYNYLFLSLDEAELYKADVKNFFSSFHIEK
jgi:hypothetical protein